MSKKDEEDRKIYYHIAKLDNVMQLALATRNKAGAIHSNASDILQRELKQYMMCHMNICKLNQKKKKKNEGEKESN
jgi:hypothetical protein